MKKPHISIFLPLVALILLCTACERLELLTEDTLTPSSEQTQPNDTTQTDTVDNIVAYSVANIIAREYEAEENAYVTGYIVGYLGSNTMKSGVFAAGDVESNILLADTPVEKDYHRCIPIQLATSPVRCKDTRDALNLADNPQMLGKKVRLQGHIKTYMDVKGIKEAHSHVLLEDDFDYEAYYASLNDTTNTDESTDSIPDTHENPSEENSEEQNQDSITLTLSDTIKYVNEHGDSPETAFCVHDFKTYIPAYLEKCTEGAIGLPECYARGYIVGNIPEGNNLSKTVFNAGNTETNIVLADSPGETDPSNCIAVQLSKGTSHQQATRDSLNLAANPQNLHRQVIVLGNIEPYMGTKTLGIKNTKEYQFVTPKQRLKHP